MLRAFRKATVQWGGWSGVLDWSGHFCQRGRMNQLLVGYARVSTDHQDPTAQRNSLAACHAGDTLVVTKLDRLALSLPDARDILDELTRRNVKLSLGG